YSIALYACETWVVSKDVEKRILVFERKCYRKLLREGWMEKMSNEELYRKVGRRDTLLQKVVRRKLQLFGHICRMDSSRKLRTLVFGVMEGNNKRGRPKREWIEDVKIWCGNNSLQQLSHIAEDRMAWRKLVQCASNTCGR